MNTDSYNTHVIPRPETIKIYNDYSQIVIVDSKDRNKYIYKNSNNYIIELNSQFNDVTEVELISMYYKYTNYEFNMNNNCIFITNDTQSIDTDVSIGIVIIPTILSLRILIKNQNHKKILNRKTTK